MKKYRLTVLALLLVFVAIGCAGKTDKLLGRDKSEHKVYVILGFHANFYHSWRGDTPDEAGFGTDIRVVREVLDMLDEANQQGLDARGYWEGESLFTFEDIIPEYAPDIIEDIRRRIDAGQDEFMPAPYSNTLFSAVTEDEMRATVEWSISNPWGSGAKDLFGGYVPFIRPQEAMTTTGQIPILKETGIDGLVLAYSTYSFTAFSNFVEPMSPEQRYGLTWMRQRDNGEKILLFPCVSAADVVNFISLEKWLLKLRKLQTSGEVDQDLAIHINFDADSDTWIPMLPKGLRWVPNSGGLPEYITAVNKYEWAEFSLPSEFMEKVEPKGEVVIRQDTADGGWDGNYSWAEKYPSHVIWTDLEKSRLYTYQAEALLSGAPSSLQSEAGGLLYKGRDSSFFHRIRGLSTTHYGMSTPIVNEERQAVAERVATDAMEMADTARRKAAKYSAGKESARRDALYSFMIKDARDDGGEATTLVRIPVVLEGPLAGLVLKDGSKSLPLSVTNVEDIGGGRVWAELMTTVKLSPGEKKKLHLMESAKSTQTAETGQPEVMDNGRLFISLGQGGIESLQIDGTELGGRDFLSPFITYGSRKKPVSYSASGFRVTSPEGESLDGVERARLDTDIPFPTPHGDVAASISVDLTLPKGSDWVVADVSVDYPYTVKDDMLHNAVQKLRRYLDLNWIEVAPFQMHPRFDANRDDPLKVWKHNYLDVTSWYEMNYGQINPKNAEIDSFNHQVTAGWVAVTDGEKGLLVGQDSEVTSVYAFMPMRLHEDEDRGQKLWLNPFGSYHGRQLDYSHLGGVGLGSEIADMASSALRANGPSYNGMSERFSLMIAPYQGDEPPEALRADAENFFYPPALVYIKTPSGVDALLKEDAVGIRDEARRQEALQAKGPLPVPKAFLANPTGEAIHVVWDESEDVRVEGYEIRYRKVDDGEWKTVEVGHTNRHPIADVNNGEKYEVSMRSVGHATKGEWTETETVEVGPVKTAGIMSLAGSATPSMVGKLLYYTMVHVLTTP